MTTHLPNVYQRSRRAQRAFTMVEVLVALLIISVCVLSLGGLEAGAMINTQAARTRSIVALQASSLASSMSANNAFWQTATAPASFTVSPTTINDPSGKLTSTQSCKLTPGTPVNPCTAQQLAAYDVQDWQANMANLLPTFNAVGSCPSPAAGTPFACTLSITCQERNLATNNTKNTANSNLVASAATGGTRSFTLYIEP